MTSLPNSGNSETPPEPEVSGRACLWLTIERSRQRGKPVKTAYRLEFLESDPSIGAPAWRLTKTDGECFDVILRPNGAVCDCPDFVNRRQNTFKGCKHVAALTAVGLMRRGL